jgi:hypothetical protein
MLSARTYITLLLIVLASVAMFFYKLGDGNMDVLISAIVAGIFLAAFKDIRILFVGWYLTAPYVVQLGGVDEANIASNVGHNFLAPAVSVILLIAFLLQRKRISFGKEELIVLLFIAYATLSSLLATGGNYADIRLIYFIYILPLLLFLVAKNIQVDSELFKMFGYVSVFHIVQALLLCSANIALGRNLYPAELQWMDVGAFGRQIGSLGSPIVFGLLLQLVFSFLFLATRYRLLAPWIFRACLVPLVILTFATFTRSVWVGAFVTFIFLVYKTSEQAGVKVFRLVMLTVFAVGVLYSALALSPDIKGRFTEDQTANFRIVMAQASVNLILDNPVFGVGYGKFDEAVERYLFDARGVYNTRDTSHVTILTILAELGLIGAVLWATLIVLNLRHPGIRLAELSKEDQVIVIVFISNAIAFLINGFFIDMRWSSFAYSSLFISLGFVQNIYRENVLLKLQTV